MFLLLIMDYGELNIFNNGDIISGADIACEDTAPLR